MADFEIAYQRTARFEGGYTADPDDNGNWTGGAKGKGVLVGTNFGITAPELMSAIKRVPTVSDMKNIPTDLVKKIYRNNYWNPIKGDEINDQNIANELYDSAVNMGVGTAIILSKRALGLPENTVMDYVNLLNNQA